jgi:hypothetical protein
VIFLFLLILGKSARHPTIKTINGEHKVSVLFTVWGIRRKLLTVTSIIVKSMSHVGLTLLFFTDESRDMTRTMARL